MHPFSATPTRATDEHLIRIRRCLTLAHRLGRLVVLACFGNVAHPRLGQISYRYLEVVYVVDLPPVQRLLDVLSVRFPPVLNLGMPHHAQHVNHIHYPMSVRGKACQPSEGGRLTLIRSNELVLAVIRLPTLDPLAPVHRIRREFLRPVHPEYAGEHIVRIVSANLQDPCHPEIPQLARRPRPFGGTLLGTLFMGDTNIVISVELFLSYYIARCASSEPVKHAARPTGLRR
jgi:hypothetical protein